MITLAIIFIVMYVIGCVIAFGRWNAIRVEDIELYGIEFNVVDKEIIFTSWFGFIMLAIMYFFGNDKYFLKF